MEFKGNPSSVVMPNTTFFKVWNDLRKLLLAHFGRMNEVCLKIRLHSIQFTNHHSLSDDIDEYLGHRAFAPEDVNQLNRQEGQLTRQNIAKYACGMLNTVGGGLILAGVLDDGRVEGFLLNKFQRDHFVLTVQETFKR